MAKTSTHESKTGGVPNQGEFYSRVAARWDKIMAALDEGLESRNPAIRIGAARTLLNKILPDIKSVEITGKNGEPIKLIVTAGEHGYIPPGWTLTPPSGGNGQLPAPIQGTSVAQESPKDDNSDNGVGEAGAS